MAIRFCIIIIIAYATLIQKSNTLRILSCLMKQYKVHKMHNYIQLDYICTGNISIQYNCILYNNYSYSYSDYYL